MNLNAIIPASWRKPVYVLFALIGVALGAIATAYGPEHVPDWHAIVSNVYLYVGGAFGLTAAANTFGQNHVGDTADAEELEPDDADDVPLDADEDDFTPELDEVEEHKADEQAALDEKLTDDTPVPDDYEPRH